MSEIDKEKHSRQILQCPVSLESGSSQHEQIQFPVISMSTGCKISSGSEMLDGPVKNMVYFQLN